MRNVKLIKSFLNVSIADATLYQIAVGIHLNNKGTPLQVPKGGFLYDIYNDPNRYLVIEKSVQCGISEYLIARSIDRARKGKTVLYILPTFALKNSFVQDRVEKTIYHTPLYQYYLKETHENGAESTSLKHIGAGSIVYAGSNTRISFISTSADDVIIDELSECAPELLPMAEERQSASTDKTTVKVGNPILPNAGIDLEYTKTDRKRWSIKHACGAWIFPDFFSHIVRQIDDNDYEVCDPDWSPGLEPACICDNCGKPYHRTGAGVWVAETTSDRSGYRISKMFSTTTTMAELLARLEEGQANETILQRLYNGDLGLPYMSAGSGFTDSVITSCATGDIMPETCESVCVMGIDVGKLLHVRINKLLADGKRQAVFIGTARDEHDIYDLWKRYTVRFGIIDADPETRFSKKLTQTLTGMFMMRFKHGQTRDLLDKKKIYTSDRTMSIDEVKEMFIKGDIILPKNIREVKEYVDHLKSSTRIWNEAGEYYKWIESGPDHFLLAEVYACKAVKLINLV